MKARWLIGGGIGVCVAGVALALAVQSSAGRTHVPSPAEQTPEQAVEYLTSEEFRGLDERRRDAYIAELAGTLEPSDLPRIFRTLREQRQSDGPPTDEEREARREMGQALRPLMTQMADRHIDAYFELPDEEKNAHLDRIIDEMEERRAQWEERRLQREAGRAVERETERESGGEERAASDRRPDRTRGRGMSLERAKQAIEHSTPEQRARRLAYREALRKRMEERGIEFRRRGPGPRP